MKKILVLVFIQSLFVANALCQTSVTPFVPGATLEGVNYFLPKTAFRVTVVAEKTITTPGELNKFAFRYLRMQDIPTEASVQWKIKEIRIDPYGVPDSSKAYNVKVKSKTLAPLVSLTHDGILLAINAKEAESQLPEQPRPVAAPAPLNAKQYLSQEILTAGNSTKMAELCAQEIYDMRDSRNSLIRGEAENTPKDGQQLKLMLDELDTQIKALEQMFCGTVQTSTEVFTLNYLPTKETERDILFRFSKHLGLVDSDDLSGRPIYISIRNTGNLPPRQENQDAKKSKLSFLPFGKNKKNDKAVFFNQPAREAITVFDSESTFAETTCSMGQFGYVEELSGILFNKKSTIRVHFHQDNGSIRKLEK